MSPDSGSSGSSSKLSATDLSWRILWDYFQNRDWKAVKLRHKLHNWYYHSKNCDPLPKDTILGTHYLKSTDDVMIWYTRKGTMNKSDVLQINTPDSMSDKKIIPSPMSDESNTSASEGDENHASSPIMSVIAYSSDPYDNLGEIEDLIQN